MQAAASARDSIGAAHARRAQDLPAVTAEIKKVSPSKGLTRADLHSAAIAAAYENTGVAHLSVLTGEPYLQSSSEYLEQVKAVVGLLVLRKDFIVDEYQVYQACAWGVGVILLIAAALNAERFKRFEQIVHSPNMTVLPELHERGELEKCRNLTTPLQGVNNRNLRAFEVSLRQALDLLPDLAGKTVATESDIRNKDDVGYMRTRGVHTFLVGETFMCADDIEAGVRKPF